MKSDSCIVVCCVIQQECCICLNNLSELDTLKINCCSNEFHVSCIYDMFLWEKNVNNSNDVKFTCPLCREQYSFECIEKIKEIINKKKLPSDIIIVCIMILVISFILVICLINAK